MKRENGYNLTHHFPFGERFDETLMKGYSISCQCIRLSNHQFIGISPLNKSIEETAAHPCLYARVPTGNYAGITAPNIMQGWQKEKGDQCPPTSPPTPSQAFGETKSHSSLGRFLHAPLTLMLKTPQ